ncbi:MAG: glycosyltransferase family 39 protein [Fuerstiella sp.]|nr:glycosyltransferase family 39 protein [Fuerstiella sp.]
MQRVETVSDDKPGGRGRLWLSAIVLLFLVVRLPVVLHSPGSQDEEWYGVPGLTVAGEGIPRVPYCRARESGSVFNGAEKILFAQPPLSFYAQAPFFAMFPPGYAAARLSSLSAACLAMVLVYAIGQQMFSDARIALTAAGLYSCSRLLFFPAVSARPDMLCGTLGLISVWLMLRWQRQPYRAAVTSGISLGLGGLTHPFAIVFAAQIGSWNLFRSGNWGQRLLRSVALVLLTTITFSMWVPIIVKSIDLFNAQFVGNILRPAGPGLLSRFVGPWNSFANQIPQLLDRAHPIQFIILTTGITFCGLIALIKRDRNASLCWLLASTAIYLLIICVGIHPIQGFWCYPAGLAWLCVAYTVVSVFDLFSTPRAIRIFVIMAIFTSLIPGSGLRASWIYLVNWSDSDFASRSFVRKILAEVPADATLTIGREFALDAYGSDRDIILACRHPMYFDSAKFPTDLLLIGRRDHDVQMIEGYESSGYQLKHLKTFGNPHDLLRCYAELWAIHAD